MAIPHAKTELEEYLVYGICPKNRRIFFGAPITSDTEDSGDFGQASVELTVRAIKRMEVDHPSKPIEIHMNSFGGDSYSLLYLIDVILASSCQFKFYGGGAIMSSAAWVLCVCDERYLYENAKVMLHDGDEVIKGKSTDTQIDSEESKNHQDKLVQILVDNSFMPKKFWDDVLQRDLNVSAEEAIKLGLVDFVVKKPKRGNLRKKREAKMKKVPHHSTMKSLTTKIYKRIKMNLPQGELKLHMPKPEEIDPDVVVDSKPIKIEEPKE